MSSELATEDLVDGFRNVCDELILLLRFVQLNAEGVRKVMLISKHHLLGGAVSDA